MRNTIFLSSQPEYEAARLQAALTVSPENYREDGSLTDEYLIRLFSALFATTPSRLWLLTQAFPILYLVDGLPQRQEVWEVRVPDSIYEIKRAVTLATGEVMELCFLPRLNLLSLNP